MSFITQGKTNWRFLLIVVILAVIVGGGILVYSKNFNKQIIFSSQTPEVKTPEKVNDETADWNTYNNEKYGFEFKYPPIPSGCEQCKIHENSEEFWLNTTDLGIIDSEGLSLSDFVDKKMKDFTIEKKEEMLIGGKKGIAVSYRFGGMSRFGSIAFVEGDNNKIFVFSFRAGGFCCNPEVDIIYEAEVYGAMLSTFRFIQ